MEVVVVIDRDDVNVGDPVIVPRVATGQLGAVQAVPVTVVDRVMLLEVPVCNVAVTVAVVLPPAATFALDGLTARLYVNAGFTVRVNVVLWLGVFADVPVIVIVYDPAGTLVVVVTVIVDEKVGLLLAGLNDTTGQFGAVHAGPVIDEVKDTD